MIVRAVSGNCLAPVQNSLRSLAAKRMHMYPLGTNATKFPSGVQNMPKVRFTDRFVSGAKAGEGGRTDYFDAVTRGLVLRVSEGGTKHGAISLHPPATANVLAHRLATTRPLASPTPEGGPWRQQHRSPTRTIPGTLKGRKPARR
jgi:hypothetical protein